MPMKTSVAKIEAREILDSRGNPTIRTKVWLEDGSVGEAAVPSGASTGTHEALELRDGGKRYGGKGVLKAVKNVNTSLAQVLKGMDAIDQRGIDEKMLATDGTKNKKKLGANTILSVSLAVARAAAISQNKPLYKYLRQTFGLKYEDWRMPVPTMNIVNGGRHADNGLTLQEFMVIPKHKKLSERVRIGVEVFHALKELLKKKKLSTGVGDEGGFAPILSKNEDALKLIMTAIQSAGYVPGKDVFLGLDMALSEFYKDGKYYLNGEKTKPVSAEEVVRTITSWIKKYPLISVEDALSEDDWESWQMITKKLGGKIKLVGDDLFVTNVERLQKGVEMNVANAILIKVNQIGSLTETIDTICLAQKHGYAVSVSHRSGETSDTFIADLAVATHADFIKTGSLSRSERVEKYNRLMEIENEVE